MTRKLDASVQALLDSVWPAAIVLDSHTVQPLWNNYGAIVRIKLADSGTAGCPPSVIAKVVDPSPSNAHPYGWNSDAAYQRKVISYQVEANFYQQDAARCKGSCRVPQCFAATIDGDSVTLLLEDLDCNYPDRGWALEHATTDASRARVEACVDWLAAFHACFLNDADLHQAPIGCYWHLATRQDEFAAMADGPLRRAAKQIDAALANSQFQTRLHGDAKLANFCFANNKRAVAAVDFQYTGKGCGMRDLAYLLGSCFDDASLIRLAPGLIDRYFTSLRHHIALSQSANAKHCDMDAVEAEWRALYPLAGADFHRFLLGWQPGHGHSCTGVGQSAGLSRL